MISAADWCQLQVSILICYHIAAEKGATLYKNIILSWQLCFKLLLFFHIWLFFRINVSVISTKHNVWDGLFIQAVESSEK